MGTAIYVAPGLHLFKTGFWPALISRDARLWNTDLSKGPISHCTCPRLLAGKHIGALSQPLPEPPAFASVPTYLQQVFGLWSWCLELGRAGVTPVFTVSQWIDEGWSSL